MSAVCRFTAAVALLFAMSLSASAAEEGFFSKLNPFGSSKPTSSSQNKPFPGFSSHSSKRKPQKTMLGKTVDSVSSTTKTAWNKTTTALSPKNLFSSGSSAKGNKKAQAKSAPTSSWSPFGRPEETHKEPKSVNEWLNQDRINPE